MSSCQIETSVSHRNERTCGISSGTLPIHESDRMQQSPAVLDDFSQCRCIVAHTIALTYFKSTKMN